MKRRIVWLLLPLTLAPALLLEAVTPTAGRMAVVAAVMALLWMTEVLPLAVTALLPLVLFPLLGIMDGAAVAQQYINSTVFLFLGGFLIALAMERWQLHRRIALSLIAYFGCEPGRITVGCTVAAAFLSMWINNTATTMLMLPIVEALIQRYEQMLNRQQGRRFAVALLLTVAYSANIGGMISLVGTAPNLIFARMYGELPGVIPVSFAGWLVIGLPVGILLLACSLLSLWWRHLRGLPTMAALGGVLAAERRALGPMRREEQLVAAVFAATALLWTTRTGLELGTLHVPGWRELLPHGQLLDDGTVAIAMGLLLFLLPARDEHGQHGTLLDTQVFARLPWDIVLLFGGGFALARGFDSSGLSAWLAQQLGGLSGIGREGMVWLVAAAVSLLTELTSNTATSQLMLPILKAVSDALAIPAYFLMLAATLTASCAFMLPVATPPNAMVFASGRLHVRDMVATGALLNLMAVSVVSATVLLLAPWVFG